jgi:hypothetical protein
MFWSGSFLLAIGESHNQRQKVQSEPVSVADLTAFLDIIFQKQFYTGFINAVSFGRRFSFYAASIAPEPLRVRRLNIYNKKHSTPSGPKHFPGSINM